MRISDWSSDVCSSDLIDGGVLYAPGKAANAGGVATSGLEMAQNSARIAWTRERVDSELHRIMKAIHRACRVTAADSGVTGNYVHGARSEERRVGNACVRTCRDLGSATHQKNKQ